VLWALRNRSGAWNGHAHDNVYRTIQKGRPRDRPSVGIGRGRSVPGRSVFSVDQYFQVPRRVVHDQDKTVGRVRSGCGVFEFEEEGDCRNGAAHTIIETKIRVAEPWVNVLHPPGAPDSRQLIQLSRVPDIHASRQEYDESRDHAPFSPRAPAD